MRSFIYAVGIRPKGSQISMLFRQKSSRKRSTYASAFKAYRKTSKSSLNSKTMASTKSGSTYSIILFTKALEHRSTILIWQELILNFISMSTYSTPNFKQRPTQAIFCSLGALIVRLEPNASSQIANSVTSP